VLRRGAHFEAEYSTTALAEGFAATAWRVEEGSASVDATPQVRPNTINFDSSIVTDGFLKGKNSHS
jgi:hypothetical protein